MMIQNNQYLCFDDVLIRPKWSSIKSRLHVDTSGYFSRNVKLDLPISSANMRTVTDANMCIEMCKKGGLGILHRYFNCTYDWHQEILKVQEKCNNYGISVGINSWHGILDFINLENTKKKIITKPNVIVFDVANAGNQKVYESVIELIAYREKMQESDNECVKWNFDIVIGNIATAEAASKYKELDIDGIKVGIGGGSACSTRLMTGVGVPQLSAIMEVSKVLRRSNIKLIADGGIEKPADFCKALAAGADCVMMGKILAYADESPGWQDGSLSPGFYSKFYQGESSFTDSRTHEGIKKVLDSRDKNGNKLKKPLSEILSDYKGGLKSSMSYCNAQNLEHYQENVEFINVSTNTLIENKTR